MGECVNNLSYTVYVHINKVNGKKYVGITKQPVKNRWNRGNGYKNNEYFFRAIKKYGWENGFEHHIVASGLTAKEAEKKEQELISKYNSHNSQNGYNITTGGELNKEQSVETRKKISDAHKGKFGGEGNPNFGKIPSEETRRKMRENNKGANNPFFGKHQSEVHRQKMESMRGEKHPSWGTHPSIETLEKQRLAKLGNKHPRARMVICLTTNMKFGTVTEAAAKYGISGTSSICRCCSSEGRRRKTAGKNPITGEPLHWAYIDELEKVKNER